jgi:hypothetical protein
VSLLDVGTQEVDRDAATGARIAGLAFSSNIESIEIQYITVQRHPVLGEPGPPCPPPFRLLSALQSTRMRPVRRHLPRAVSRHSQDVARHRCPRLPRQRSSPQHLMRCHVQIPNAQIQPGYRLAEWRSYQSHSSRCSHRGSQQRGESGRVGMNNVAHILPCLCRWWSPGVCYWIIETSVSTVTCVSVLVTNESIRTKAARLPSSVALEKLLSTQQTLTDRVGTHLEEDDNVRAGNADQSASLPSLVVSDSVSLPSPLAGYRWAPDLSRANPVHCRCRASVPVDTTERKDT